MFVWWTTKNLILTMSRKSVERIIQVRTQSSYRLSRIFTDAILPLESNFHFILVQPSWPSDLLSMYYARHLINGSRPKEIDGMKIVKVINGFFSSRWIIDIWRKLYFQQTQWMNLWYCSYDMKWLIHTIQFCFLVRGTVHYKSLCSEHLENG